MSCAPQAQGKTTQSNKERKMLSSFFFFVLLLYNIFPPLLNNQQQQALQIWNIVLSFNTQSVINSILIMCPKLLCFVLCFVLCYFEMLEVMGAAGWFLYSCPTMCRRVVGYGEGGEDWVVVVVLLVLVMTIHIIIHYYSLLLLLFIIIVVIIIHYYCYYSLLSLCCAWLSLLLLVLRINLTCVKSYQRKKERNTKCIRCTWSIMCQQRRVSLFVWVLREGQV